MAFGRKLSLNGCMGEEVHMSNKTWLEERRCFSALCLVT
jgi:hypothetical protein